MWELDYKGSWALKNWCFWTVVLEKTVESPLDCKEIKPVHPKEDQSWIFIGRTDAEAEAPILWPPDGKNRLIGKRPWFWERLRVEGEGDGRGWDGWMASLTQWTWVWASSGSWWWTEKPGVLQSMGPQRVRYDWATELNWTWLYIPLLPLWCLWIIFKTPFHSNCILIICLKLSCSAEEHRLLKPSMLLLPLTSHDLGH